ncbi:MULTISPECIES: FAD-dependent oxidoreductase [Rhizobium]|uniref:2-polyprenyl-6-methoxyphenol hydroxylase-like FAD-dependent oxidoreductase n=1 Tax=Rhizobium esperanzae TaxID=1967781 RepID=A0A7W6Y184_9HYPH|nr:MULTISPECIES: FAD-dependent oxidoreductase [Rhizobium]MBB4343026.1 2-polyprenyl-6-methoxyphenol hydroxylase-like FAD-dependent oxidoreductase [Rhizobium leguminosarum]MBB4443439.1 2-polyprenyl-6-methoxyphenol hydroxylase-like FAD-dependent oxidoreductase [Rhizobium esperanzae]MBB5260845.1 2-polyprenyl-6-methoxyphenol hydroxylase-like FAD-dependent oxidoreductase [Rhizobium leguminosarum]MBB6296104.1 2-polyprenyl-6-methoxyphenol hydroxylase-like FAD-dependent oxidoreductase [Rhizobium legumin
MTHEVYDVAIAGGGPFGLMLANELGRRGVSTVLFDEKSSTAFNPQANATQARTMEHFRRLGFADEIRALGMPEDFPTDIAYFTRYARHELARFRLPSAKEAREKILTMTGSWSAAELPHRVSQKFVERVLRKHAEALSTVSVNYGWRISRFEDVGDAVTMTASQVGSESTRSVRAKYLIGGDGAKSFIRRTLGIRYQGDGGAVRDFFGGKMFALYLRCPQFYEVVPFAPAWMNVAFNPERRAFMAAVDGKGEFAFHTQLKEGESEDDISDAQALKMFQTVVGYPVEGEILSRGTWTAGFALVAEKFQAGRIFLGGDAVHLFTPAGGLGYNTAVDDAVNLGWKLASVVKGNAPSFLLDTYELERRPVAVRNTGFARAFAESIGNYVPKPDIEADSDLGSDLRREAGAYLEAHGRSEFNIPGVTFGARYDHSPIILAEGEGQAPDLPEVYVPNAAPGGRAPHVWLNCQTSLFDRFGFEWTLLRLRPSSSPGTEFVTAARMAGMDLTVVDIKEDQLRAIYREPLVLIRPDQVIAWRGDGDGDAVQIIETVLGHIPAKR